jgi:DNA-binding CsgD family transcriptional regulator
LLAQLAGHAAIEAARRLLPRRHHRNPGLRPVLTRQQRVILQLLSEGKTDFEISRILGCKEETVGSHVRDLFARYGVNKRTLLVSLAWQDGYVTYSK